MQNRDVSQTDGPSRYGLWASELCGLPTMPEGPR